MSDCIDDVACWFLENAMLLNPTKTDAMLCGTQAQRRKVDTSAGIMTWKEIGQPVVD